jgi:hypothetical protein
MSPYGRPLSRKHSFVSRAITPLVAVRVEAAFPLLVVEEPTRVTRLTGAASRLSNRRSSRTPLARARN